MNISPNEIDLPNNVLGSSQNVAIGDNRATTEESCVLCVQVQNVRIIGLMRSSMSINDARSTVRCRLYIN